MEAPSYSPHSAGPRIVLVLLGMVLALDPARGAFVHGMASTVNPLATDAAVDAMRRGGNAIDGAVAAALTLGVVDGHNSGIGGGCFMLIRSADGRVTALDGRETAPALATRDMFLREGKVVAGLSEAGALAAGVPGSLAVYDDALRRFGKRPLREHLEAAAILAEKGFALDRSYAGRLAASANALRLFSASRQMLLREDGSPYKMGEVLRLPDLAATYRRVGSAGTEWFYGGEFAAAVETWMKGNGGLIRARDFADYKVKEREPIRTSYHGRTIVGFPPPSSGGVHVAQILNILETFDLKRMGRGSADFAHVVAEAMKLAFADRAYWLGDPDFAPVPRGLVSKAYARGLAGRIRMGEAIRVEGHGRPEAADSDVFGKHTTHFSVADAAGNWVACTATVNTSFGCKVVIPGTGVVLNNQMDDFSALPGEMNYFGLVGAEANAVAPGKRPLSSMSPTVVEEDGRPVLSVGAAGGPTIISQTVLAIVGVVDFGLSPAEALAAPRLHHQWKPDTLELERRFGAEVRRELERRGHRVTEVGDMGACQAVGWDSKTGALVGAHDPRVEGKADGW